VDKHPVRGEERVRLLFDALLELGGVQPDDAVLDIGCGRGHFAERFTTYLSERGSFEGLDVRPKFIANCTRRIASEHRNFHFTLAAVFNTHYNPQGRVMADSYRLPYDDNTFDFVYGLSLFTHMMPAEVRNYLYNTARILKPGGRSFFTYLLLNDEAQAAIAAGRTGPQARLPHDHGDYRVKSQEVPESQVAHDEELVQSFYADAGLSTIEPVLYGDWTGRSEAITRQDIVLAEKS
jgi:ubiquinone/menaquinone biosynthesis C-methylase UbiE